MLILEVLKETLSAILGILGIIPSALINGTFAAV